MTADTAVAFVDRDWVGADPDSPALVYRGHSLEFAGRHVDVPPDVPPEHAAFAALAGVAEAAVSAAKEGGGRTAVLGIGLVAWLVRELLGRVDELDGAATVVVASRDPAGLERALSAVAPGGRIVLVGERTGSVLVDLYSTVHLRGLELVGIPGPLAAPIGWTALGTLPWLQPEDAVSAAKANSRGLWYRIPWPQGA